MRSRAMPLLLLLSSACMQTADPGVPIEPSLAPAGQDLRAAYARPAAEWPRPTVDEGVAFVELGLLPKPSFPSDNPWSQAKQALGHALFFDGRLSGTGQM